MTRDEYQKHHRTAKYMSLEKLEKKIGELYEARFIEHDIEVVNIHRIYARVYTLRTRKGGSAVFKEYIK